MRTRIYLKTQAQIVDECEARLTDSSNTLATATQYKEAVNEAVLMWGNRVVIPRIYELSDGFTTGIYEYTLPAYIQPPFDVQVRSTSYPYLGTPIDGDDTFTTWHSFAGYSVEPTTTGGFVLRLPTAPYTEDARIIWYAPNGYLPTASITLISTILDDANNCSTTDEDTVFSPTGFIKIEDEWMAYADLYNDGTGQTFRNLIRGYAESIATFHNMGAAISFGVAVDDPRLWVQLYDYVAAYIHALQMHKGTGEDVSRHEKLMSFFQQRADSFWRTHGYISQRPVRRLQTPQSIGPLAW